MNLTLPQMKAINVVCTGVEVGSAIAAPILISRANKKAREYLEHYEFTDEPLKLRAKYTWKYYIPAAAVIGLGIGAAVTNGVCTNNLTKLLSAEITAHALTVASNTEVKEAILKGIKEKYGLDVESEMRDTGAQALTNSRIQSGTSTALALPAPDGCIWLCDDTHGRYFQGNMEDVKKVVNDVNQAITKGQEMCLRDIYDALDMPAAAIDGDLYPANDGLFELRWSTSHHPEDPNQLCAHFGFRDLVVAPRFR